MKLDLIPLVIISLTTIPERLKTTTKIIENELKSLSGNYVIVLNLPLSYKKFSMSKSETSVKKLEGMVGKHFILNRCEDYGPLTKLLPTLSLNFPDESIILVRDDNCYHLEAFSIIARKQMTNFSKSFTYYSYDYKGITIPQGVDVISFWKPNLNGFVNFANNALKSDYCAAVDDMIIGNYLRKNGIGIETVDRKWKWPWKPDCFNSNSGLNSGFELFKQTGKYSRDNSNLKCDKYLN